MAIAATVFISCCIYGIPGAAASVLPTVSGFTPAGGGSGTVVTITGQNLSTIAEVTFGWGWGVSAEFETVSDTEIRATVPPQPPPPLELGATLNGPICLMSVDHVQLCVEGFDGSEPVFETQPPIGRSGDAVRLTGEGFVTASSVRFGSVEATFSIEVDEIRTTIPADAIAGPVCVTNAVGTGCAPFIVGDPPVISGFSPAGGGPGTIVTITGSAFTGATAVTFAAAGFGMTRVYTYDLTVISDTEIRVPVPPSEPWAPLTTGPIGVERAVHVLSAQDFIACGAPRITAPNESCPGVPAVASVPPAGTNFVWSVGNGSIVDGQGTPSITFVPTDPGFVFLSVTMTDFCGQVQSSSKPLNAGIQQPMIIKHATECALSVGSAFVNNYQEGVTYEWSVTNGTLLAQEEGSVEFLTGPSGAVGLTVTATGCGLSLSTSDEVAIDATPEIFIEGSDALCDFMWANVGSWEGSLRNADIEWTVTGATVLDSRGTWVEFEPDFTEDVVLTVTVSNCGTTATATRTIPLEQQYSLIAPAAVLPGGTAEVRVDPPLQDATYGWSVDGAVGSWRGDGSTLSLVAQESGTIEITVEVTTCLDSVTLQRSIPISADAGSNTAPLLAPVGNRSALAGTPLAIDLEASDPDGNALTFTVSPDLPGATIDATTGLFLWTPTPQQTGAHEITFTVSDGELTDSETVVLTVSIVGLELTSVGFTFDIYNQGTAPALPSHVRAVISDYDSLGSHELGSGLDDEVDVQLVSPTPCEGAGCTPALLPGTLASYSGSVSAPRGGFGRHITTDAEGNQAVDNDGSFTLTTAAGSFSSVSLLWGRHLWIEADASRDLEGNKADESRQLVPEFLDNDARRITVPAAPPLFRDLTHLSATFESLGGGVGNGSPRLELHLEGHGVVRIYLGPAPGFLGGDGEADAFSWVNVIGGDDRRYDTTGITVVEEHLKSDSMTHAEAVALAGGFTISRVDFVVHDPAASMERRYRLDQINVGTASVDIATRTGTR